MTCPFLYRHGRNDHCPSILDIAPLNRGCTALKAEATPTLTFVLASAHHVLRLAEQSPISGTFKAL
jgi:hypothetical protein